MFNRILLLLVISGMSTVVSAQSKSSIKFGKISPEDFELKDLKVDTTEGAVIIADIGSSYFEGNTDGWFTLVHTVHRRVKVYDTKGFDLGNVEIELYVSNNGQAEERVEKLKAYTYNLEGGKVVETKISDDAIFKEKRNKNIIVKKFSMPALKAGSIFEYSYIIKSDFLQNLQPWSFQGGYPRIWSEYDVSMPGFFEYVSLFQGFRKFDINEKKNESQIFNIRIPDNSAFGRDQTTSLTAENTRFHWVMKNVPPLKEEKFTNSLKDYISRIEFQLAAYNFPNSTRRDLMGNWVTATMRLLEDEDFGAGLRMPNNWLDDDIRGIRNGTTDSLAIAQKLFDFVQSSIKNIGMRGIYLTKPVKEVFKSRSGYANEINLLLATMLRHEKIDACPVILSTVAYGHTNSFYPLMQKFNYVICMATIDSVRYFLDASQPYLGFGRLPGYVHNGHARAINSSIDILNFNPDTLKESSVTSVFLFNDEAKPGRWVGSYTDNFGYNESGTIRRYIADNGKEGIEKNVKKRFTEGYNVSDFEWENENQRDNSVKLKYKITVEPAEDPDLIYFNPMISGEYKENPFKSENRMYPVEMPSLTDETYILKLQIPEGYVVDEMPRSERVLFNESEGMFEYLIAKDDREINLRTRLKLDKATFQPEDYESLRNFYDYIVKKYAESIVFKRKK